MDFTIRRAEPGEFGPIGDLTVDTYVGDGLMPPGHPYAEELRSVAHRAAEAQVLVAVETQGADAADGTADSDGSLLGSVTYADDGSPWAEVARADEAEFRMLVVAAAARRRGVGEALVRACIARAREAGHRALVLSTDTHMTAAHRLYDRLGFVRNPSRDWSPLPNVELLFYELPLR